MDIKKIENVQRPFTKAIFPQLSYYTAKDWQDYIYQLLRCDD